VVTRSKRLPARSLGHAQRNADAVADEEGPQAQADRHRQLLLDQRPDVLVLEEAAPQVEARKAFQHQPEALGRGLVEAVELADLLKAPLIDPLRAAITQAPTLGHSTSGPRLGFGQVLLHRPARHELDDGKGQQQHAKERGQHEQQALEDIGGHRVQELILRTRVP